MIFRIGGVDITPYIAFNGLKWSRNDVDGPNAGRNAQGDMIRDRVAIKYRWDITCRPLTAQEQVIILQLIQPVEVVLDFTDPLDLNVKSGMYYSNNFPSTYYIRRENGTEIWTGLAFPLVQI